MSNNRFPEGFLWGAATSSHQVEGGNVNDWTKWEDAGHVKNHELSGAAADHWNRYEEDFDLLEELNLNAYRFSIEWSRVEREKGRFDDEAIQHYREMLESLRKRKIEPIVTLHHFTNPLWLKDWTHEENIGHFESYVEHIVSKLGDLVEYWCTINEPNNFVLMGYGADFWPPGYKSMRKAVRALRVLAKTHKNTYLLIKRAYQSNGWDEPKISVAAQMNHFKPNSNNPLNRLTNAAVRRIRNYYFLDKIKNHLDFLGFNYYFTFHTKWYSIGSFTDIRYEGLGVPLNELGWNVEPEGMYWVLKQLYDRYNLPIIITENGVPDSRDAMRKWYIVSHLKQVKRAIDEGTDIRGYMHWSLIDNFEWADGYSGRFGLVAVNFDTQKRTVRESAWTYADIAKANALPENLKVDEP